MAVIFQDGNSGHFSFTIWTILAVKSYIFYYREARCISLGRPGSFCLPYFHHWKNQNLLIIPSHETITCYQSTSLPLECSKLKFLEYSTSLAGNSKLGLCVPIWNIVTTLYSYQCFHNDCVPMFQTRQDCGERGRGTNVWRNQMRRHVFQGSNCTGAYRTESCLVSANVFYYYKLL